MCYGCCLHTGSCTLQERCLGWGRGDVEEVPAAWLNFFYSQVHSAGTETKDAGSLSSATSKDTKHSNTSLTTVCPIHNRDRKSCLLATSLTRTSHCS